jgi:thiosulfate dehydrogenase
MKTIGILALFAVGCQDTVSARAHGRKALFEHGLSDSPANAFECADCHEVEPDTAGDRIFPGYTLVDSAFRESFWGGYERTLRDSMSFCRVYFMRGVPFEEDDDDGRAILEYLLSISPTDPAPALPLTVTLTIDAAPARGDPARGEVVYANACHHCHGSPGGKPPDRMRADATPMPGDDAGWADLYDEIFPGVPYATIVTEKVRHGRFFLVGGIMPLFSQEALSDEDFGALLAYLGI